MSLFNSEFNNVFISTDDFAVSALFKLGSSSAQVTVKGNFFNDTENIPLQNMNAEMKAPVFQCLESSVEGADHSSTLKIDDDTYYVISNTPDGTGMTLLYLSKQQITG